METKMIKVPFDVELAKKITEKSVDGRIVTRDGRSARVICFDAHCEDNIVALVEDSLGIESTFNYLNDGKFYIGDEKECDLFLEIPEYMTFKDGDILMLRNQYHFVFVYNSEIGKYGSYFGITLDDYDSFFDSEITSEHDENIIEFRKASTEEKQKLIDILKERKEPKAKEYLKRFFGIEVKQEYEFKPKDWVLVRNYDLSEWWLATFSHTKYDSVGNRIVYGCTSGGYYRDCIPYNEETAHLLGTTEKYE